MKGVYAQNLFHSKHRIKFELQFKYIFNDNLNTFPSKVDLFTTTTKTNLIRVFNSNVVYKNTIDSLTLKRLAGDQFDPPVWFFEKCIF